jgi:riboflavin kinase, archaea type
LPKIKLAGTVYSGAGQGKKFIALPWVREQLIGKLGFCPYLGTLNIRLTKESLPPKKQLETLRGIVVNPKEGYFSGLLMKAKINNLECYIVIPKVPNYPADVLELVAPVSLREHLKLADGDCVTLEVIV